MHDVQRREVKKLPTLRGRTVVNLFFEDSTRTRSSFEIAGKWLSADVINISGKGSSTSKGESLRDTVLTVAAMGVDGLVIRHHASGAAPPGRAVGRRERHQRRRRHARAPDPGPAGRLHAAPARSATSTAAHVAIVGDLTHSRVLRSNLICLARLGAHVTVVAPPTLMPSGIGGLGRRRRLRDVVRPGRRAAARRTR